MEGVGGSVGPDLSRVWDTMALEKILESIVEPSKEIKEGFQTYRVATTGEQVFTGLKIKEDDKEVVIRDANGRDTRVSKDEIDSLVPSKVSLMPDNVVSQISYEQFIDLLAFLKSRKEQESLRGLVAEIGVTGPFPADLKAEKPEVLSRAKWQTIHAEPNGRLNLSAAFSGADSAVYARAYVFSPKKQTAMISAQAENPLRMWINDASAFVRQSAGRGADETFEVQLKKGWNVLLMKVANTGKSGTLGVRIAGEGLQTAGTPAELPVAAAGGP
jgi:putative heme-binding domain-containing protein